MLPRPWCPLTMHFRSLPILLFFFIPGKARPHLFKVNRDKRIWERKVVWNTWSPSSGWVMDVHFKSPFVSLTGYWSRELASPGDTWKRCCWHFLSANITLKKELTAQILWIFCSSPFILTKYCMTAVRQSKTHRGNRKEFYRRPLIISVRRSRWMIISCSQSISSHTCISKYSWLRYSWSGSPGILCLNPQEELLILIFFFNPVHFHSHFSHRLPIVVCVHSLWQTYKNNDVIYFFFGGFLSDFWVSWLLISSCCGLDLDQSGLLCSKGVCITSW